MKKCAVISCYIVNEYRKSLVRSLVNTFNKYDIDVILVSSDHIPHIDGVKNYITCKNIRNQKMLSEGLSAYFAIGNMIFYKPEFNTNASYSSYFFVMYQIISNYTKNLGYEYMYFIDQDMALTDEYAADVLGSNIDISKFCTYQFSNAEDYQVIFFHGNTKILSEIFSEANLNKLESLAKERLIGNVETGFAIIAKDHPDLILYKLPERNIFSKINLFSSRNVADIYHNAKEKKYIFLHAKGDTSPDSFFSAELILDGNVIYSNTHRHTNHWNILELEHNKNYTIKYYDAHISPETLYKTNTLYTDPVNISTKNYIVC